MKAQIVVAKNLRRLRVRRGLSQEALATDASVDRTYVGRLERGQENPTVAVLERLALALTCDIRDFFDSDAASAPPVQPLQSGRKPKGGSRSSS